MRKFIVLILLFFMGFGCLEESNFPSSGAEHVSSLDAVDLDGEGTTDYYIYDFTPFNANDMEVQRQMTVVVTTNAEYTSYNSALTDANLLQADQSLEEFSKARIQADLTCSNSLGVSNVVCSNTQTCKELCSAASLKCKNIATYNEEILTDSMLSYISDNNELRSLTLNTRNVILNLRTASDAEKKEFLSNTRKIVALVADINANPVYVNKNLKLCTKSDFGIPFVMEAEKKIGEYQIVKREYTYRIIISIKPTKIVTDDFTLGGAGFVDRMPASVITQPEIIASRQGISATQQGNDVVIRWDSSKNSKEGYIVMYTFTSTTPPESVLSSLQTPDVKTRKMNLILLAPLNIMLLSFNVVLGNYYIAYGLSLGIILALLFFVYTIIVLIFSIIGEKAGGASFLTGFRKAFGRTDIRWKTDIIVAIMLLVGGYYIATVMTVLPSIAMNIVESIDFLLKNEMGMISITLIFMGTVMVYLAIENFIKIIVLERAYGMVIRQEKDVLLSKASMLKTKIKELGDLIEQYSKEDFDISKEYDIYTSFKLERVDALAKEMSPRSKALVDEQLNHVEGAVTSLQERKKLADTNWTKWKENIAKLLDEQGEVYAASLITVPASLRAWALSKYVKETSIEGVYFERDAVKKRRVSPIALVQEMIEKRLIKGAVVLKQDKVIVSEFEEHYGTVETVLALKLITYLNSLAKNLGQHPPQSFATIGEKNVILLLKDHNIQTVLFLSKDKFKEAVEQWKAKSKIFSSS
ncbi:MAG: hypothetical protein ABID61_00770 [Candidatus Micrarchaeota archaeon]